MDEAIQYLEALKVQADAEMVELMERVNIAQTYADSLPNLMGDWGTLNARVTGYDAAIAALQAYVPPAPEEFIPEEELTEFVEQPEE